MYELRLTLTKLIEQAGREVEKHPENEYSRGVNSARPHSTFPCEPPENATGACDYQDLQQPQSDADTFRLVLCVVFADIKKELPPSMTRDFVSSRRYEVISVRG